MAHRPRREMFVGTRAKVLAGALQAIGTGVDTKTISLEPTKSDGTAAADGDNIAGWKCTTTADAKYVPGSCRG